MANTAKAKTQMENAISYAKLALNQADQRDFQSSEFCMYSVCDSVELTTNSSILANHYAKLANTQEAHDYASKAGEVADQAWEAMKKIVGGTNAMTKNILKNNNIPDMIH